MTKHDRESARLHVYGFRVIFIRTCTCVCTVRGDGEMIFPSRRRLDGVRRDAGKRGGRKERKKKVSKKNEKKNRLRSLYIYKTGNAEEGKGGERNGEQGGARKSEVWVRRWGRRGRRDEVLR